MLRIFRETVSNDKTILRKHCGHFEVILRKIRKKLEKNFGVILEKNF